MVVHFPVVGGTDDVQHLPGQRDVVQRGEREGRPTLRPQHRVPRQTRAVPQISPDHSQDGESVHQVKAKLL